MRSNHFNRTTHLTQRSKPCFHFPKRSSKHQRIDVKPVRGTRFPHWHAGEEEKRDLDFLGLVIEPLLER